MTFTNIACDILLRRAPYARPSRPVTEHFAVPASSPRALRVLLANKRDYVCVPTMEKISASADHERTRPSLPRWKPAKSIIPVKGSSLTHPD